MVTITRSGYVKRTKSAIYKTQGRGGKGVIGAKPKEGDIVAQVLTTTNHAFVLVFSNRGKVYRIKAHEIPEKERIARGVSIRNILPFGPEESVAAILDTKDFATHKYLVIATRKGIIKKTEFTAYNTSRRDGVIALNLREDDEVVSVKATAGTDELVMVSHKAISLSRCKSRRKSSSHQSTGSGQTSANVWWMNSTRALRPGGIGGYWYSFF